jgi:tRNA/rRNA methyltransferase/tRNA (cytidine32/uridine32-2'-O)-methyltransferase
MKNMGVSSLRLVRPVEYDAYRLEGIAHDTADIIERIQHFDDLDSAIADCVYVAAYTARRRAAKRLVTDPRSRRRRARGGERGSGGAVVRARGQGTAE